MSETERDGTEKIDRLRDRARRLQDLITDRRRSCRYVPQKNEQLPASAETETSAKNEKATEGEVTVKLRKPRPYVKSRTRELVESIISILPREPREVRRSESLAVIVPSSSSTTAPMVIRHSSNPPNPKRQKELEQKEQAGENEQYAVIKKKSKRLSLVEKLPFLSAYSERQRPRSDVASHDRDTERLLPSRPEPRSYERDVSKTAHRKEKHVSTRTSEPQIDTMHRRSLPNPSRLRPEPIYQKSANPKVLSRAMTMAESARRLPPLIEVTAPEPSDVADTVEPKAPRKPKQYTGSHTTSTYQGGRDAAPDASPRRHLIGFLHRTSHLSLTSELSADASFYLIGHRGRRFEESTIASESDARIFSDDDDQTRVSTSTDITSVSRQQQNLYRRRKNRRKFRQPSRASSFTSITESSMSLDVITVTLNMDTVNFLGISIVGQSSQRGDTGIYVANIMKGGAVALDGRIEAGDMILQVNDVSFENFTNDQAVDVLREAVARRGPIKLTVAKCWESGQKSCFTVPRPRDEPVRPIDTQAWIQHTNAMRGMPSIMEGSEGAPTPVPGQYPPHNRPPSSSTVTSGGGSGPNTVIGGGPTHMRLDMNTDKRKVVEAMAMPNSGLDIRDRTWLKIPMPMCFLGTDLVNWLLDHVDGLKDNKEAKKYARELLKAKLIRHVVKKVTFTEQCYYALGEDFERQRLMTGECSSGRSDVGSLPPPPPGFLQPQPQQAPRWPMMAGTNGVPSAPSMVSGYAQMPPPSSSYPYNPLLISHQRTGAPDVNSQASGHSNEGSSGSEHRRMARAVLPPAPSLSSSQPPLMPLGSSTTVSLNPPQHRLEEFPTELASSRQSFRLAVQQPHPLEFFVDNF
uniref:PDZ domain-containing protein n=1 Tax=Steinernema glaseri TaxID=37863 RepID=A0A1I8AKJ6_9BILA